MFQNAFIINIESVVSNKTNGRAGIIGTNGTNSSIPFLRRSNLMGRTVKKSLLVRLKVSIRKIN